MAGLVLGGCQHSFFRHDTISSLPFSLKQAPVGSLQDLGCLGAVLRITSQPGAS